MSAPSLDEVYFDVTNYVNDIYMKENPYHEDYHHHNHENICVKRVIADKVVNEIRAKIFEATRGLTCSAGIANNFLLAKIAADVKKPNGQFQIEPSRTSILNFLDPLPTRKIPGVGKVMEHTLEAIGIKSISDIRNNLYLLRHIFSKAQYKLLLYACLGISSAEANNAMIDGNQNISTSLVPTSNDVIDSISTSTREKHIRKSLGTERTFTPTHSKHDLKVKLYDICMIVSKEMVEKELHGKQVTLKCKTSSFELTTRSKRLDTAIQSFSDIFNIAYILLSQEWPKKPLRLLGVIISKLVTIQIVDDGNPNDDSKETSTSTNTKNSIVRYFIDTPSSATPLTTSNSLEAKVHDNKDGVTDAISSSLHTIATIESPKGNKERISIIKEIRNARDMINVEEESLASKLTMESNQHSNSFINDEEQVVDDNDSLCAEDMHTAISLHHNNLSISSESYCPICNVQLQGDMDDKNSHVNACLDLSLANSEDHSFIDASHINKEINYKKAEIAVTNKRSFFSIVTNPCQDSPNGSSFVSKRRKAQIQCNLRRYLT